MQSVKSGSIILGERQVSTSDMLHRSARAAMGLHSDFGITDGDTVAVLMRNDIAFLEATFAADYLGAYAVPVNWHFREDEISYILTDSDARVLIAHADLLAGLDRKLLPDGIAVLAVSTPDELQQAFDLAPTDCQVTADDTCWDSWLASFAPWDRHPSAERSSMIYTSGTTGRPKGVRRAPMAAEHHRLMKMRQDRIGAGTDRVNLINGPMYHSAPNAQALSVVRGGGTVVIQPKFDPEDLLRLIERHRVSHMHMVPTMFVRLIKLPEDIRQKYDLSSLEWVIHAAAPCPPDVKREMIRWWGPIINEYYGATEIGMVVFCTTADWLTHPGTVGSKLPGVELKILDENRRECGTGDVGEIFAHFAGFTDFTYQNNEEEHGANAWHGLFSVGDMGYLDGDGFLYISDRKKDMVISGGVNIYPTEIEAVLLNHPHIRDCAVFGIPDAEFGESLAAIIEPTPQDALTPEVVKQYVRENLAGYKIPKLIEFRSDLPREDSGKIRKRLLRQKYWEDAGRSI